MTRAAASRIAGVLLLPGVAVALPYLIPPYYMQFATKIMIMGIVAIALNLVVGFGGLVSLCHAAFFGIGGYALALTTPKYEAAALWLTLPVAMAASAFAAFFIGALSLRTRGVYFIMVTLAFGQMLYSLLHDSPLAGGSDGAFIYVKPSTALLGYAGPDLENAKTFYFAVALALCFTSLLIWQLVRSPFGHALAAARDNERRARSIGFPIFRMRLAAFTISGALAGLGGYLAAAQYGYVVPDMLGWHQSATVLVMVVLGGMEGVLGPLFGAAALLGMEEVLKASTEHWKLAEGLAIIVLVIAYPGGLRQLIAFAAPETGVTGSAREKAGRKQAEGIGSA
jgi:branched-chain amino acid transport system permease protein